MVQTVVGSEEEAKKVLEASKGDEVKKMLMENTDRAFKEGAFGLPWFVGEFSFLFFFSLFLGLLCF